MASSAAGLALYGGAFDPPHRSHRRLAEAARDQLPVSEVWVLPSGDHAFKGALGTPAAHRLAMCERAFAGAPGVTVSTLETTRTGVTYTVDTLAALVSEQPERPLFWLLGSDNLQGLSGWREFDRLLDLCTLAIYPREGHPFDPDQLLASGLSPAQVKTLGNQDHWLRGLVDDVSATEIRSHLGRGEAPEALDSEVLAYIRQHSLYGFGSRRI